MRIAGVFLIGAVCVLIGVLKSGELKRRVSRLEAAVVLVRWLAGQIRYRMPPVSELIESAAGMEEFRLLPFLAVCAEDCRSGTPFPEAWAAAVGDKRLTGELVRRDVELLLSFGRSLGTTDAQGQLENCALHEERLGASLETAREERTQRGRLCVRLGVLCGAAAVIILW